MTKVQILDQLYDIRRSLIMENHWDTENGPFSVRRQWEGQPSAKRVHELIVTLEKETPEY